MAATATITKTPKNPSALDIDAAAWGAAMMRRDRAKLRYDLERAAFAVISPGDPTRDILADLCDSSVDELDDADRQLMRMPAPHGAALKWKLQEIIEVGADGFTGSYSADYVAQTLADIARLLGDA